MLDKYKLLKSMYPDYLVLIKKKDDYITFGIDKDICKYFNYLLIDNVILTEDKISVNKSGNYYRYYFNTYLLKYLNK